MSKRQVRVRRSNRNTPDRQEKPWRRTLAAPAKVLRGLFQRLRAVLGWGLDHRNWLAAGAVVIVVLVWGTPHLGWSYTCRHPITTSQPCRNYERCVYLGIQGGRVLYPAYGESCGLIKLVPIDWSQISPA